MDKNRKPFPLLGRMLGWVDKPGSAMRLVYALGALCLVLFALDFTFTPHGHFGFETIPGFFGVYGFVMFTALILAAKGLRRLVKRPEDYYGDTAVDTEDYPEELLDKVDYDA
ncbi:hypothetical protein U5922_002740 [Aquicoccus sp. G2-2]|uniref:hypothetical protein n=1 Tax=Aquicoccus sp. G2-2 TaxID=3092120 RepID=UPI002ADF50C5|nr:hypothetical protein [Aquicoccus sp. G2-2]MEA1112438.1 hypothetical protein [Aquicoccus sp. G2-2]